MRRRTLLKSALAVGAGTAVATTIPALASKSTAAKLTVARGGSNYGWYQLDGCDREPYGVVASFHNAPDTIAQQLRTMFDAGQRRLRIPLFHRRGTPSGTLIDSTGGDLPAQARQNLTDLLRLIKETGFEEIQVAYIPSGGNTPYEWPSWNEDLYLENWNVVRNIRPIVAGAGAHYRLDLYNEAIPTVGQEVLLQYARRLWGDYTREFGKDDTIGFSTIADPDRVRRIPEVYGDNPPHLFDFHFYFNDQLDEHGKFTETHRLMNEMGYTSQGWTIGEMHYDDPVAAEQLSRAITETGRQVFYALQWPWTREKRCEHVDVTPPVDFGNYIGVGF
ncbi:hypothetical protein EV193_101507 [Herbihabitans rhizosphaerae]|uniref:Cellulase (Glycosyl hydrolase family 5) n=1 Tax=Herbihabitans rhizosphaerae TaxID=1872711 RepID=A0A4Q7L7L6_9PSEU|nr:twin-arginine translocation signal domain-containing protein [Herbihabitans rhizosphaerae]RZS44631.1 hypothetical protein EV193_101507 [Herbihabitans rhizosphaerae]